MVPIVGKYCIETGDETVLAKKILLIGFDGFFFFLQIDGWKVTRVVVNFCVLSLHFVWFFTNNFFYTLRYYSVEVLHMLIGWVQLYFWMQHPQIQKILSQVHLLHKKYWFCAINSLWITSTLFIRFFGCHCSHNQRLWWLSGQYSLPAAIYY